MRTLKSRQHSLYGSLSEDYAPTGYGVWNQPTCIPLLVVAFLASMATGGPTYAFAVYSKALKDILHLSQSRLDTVASLPNFFAGIISFLPGMLVDTLGIRAGATMGGLCLTAVFFVYWLVVVGRIVPSGHVVTVLCLLGFLIQVSNSLIVGSVFKGLVVSTGHGSRGYAVGAAKAYIGIASGVYAIIFKSLHFGTDLDFILMASTLAFVFVALPAFIWLPKKQETVHHTIVDVTTSTHYKVIYSGLAVLIGYVLWSSLNSMVRVNANRHVTDEPRYCKVVFIFLSWLGPIASLFFLKRQKREYDPVPDAPETNDPENDARLIIPLTNHTLKQVLQTKSAWLFLWTATVLAGSGTMMTNNMAQMVESRGFASNASANCLSLFSVAQSVARIVVGVTSERALSWETKSFGLDSGVPRSVFVVLASVTAVIGHVVLAMATTQPLFVVGVILSGVAFGSIWPLTVLVVADVYGTMYHGRNYLFIDGFASAFGALFISKYIVQFVYESHIDPEIDALTCYGIECFRDAEVIVTSLCVTCIMTSALFAHVTRSCYGQPIPYRFFG